MELKKCPYCGKSVLEIAKVCKYCGKSLEEKPVEQVNPVQETKPATSPIPSSLPPQVSAQPPSPVFAAPTGSKGQFSPKLIIAALGVVAALVAIVVIVIINNNTIAPEKLNDAASKGNVALVNESSQTLNAGTRSEPCYLQKDTEKELSLNDNATAPAEKAKNDNANASAQYYIPFITLDPDKYTNIREEPNSRSKIVDRVYEHEVFYFNGTDLSNYDKSNWIPVSTDAKSGYIYKKHILQLDELPSLPIKRKLHNKSIAHDTLLNANATLSVIMYIAPFDKNKHKLEVTNDIDGEHVWSIDGKEFYGTGYRMPVREIQAIEILRKGTKTVLPYEKIKRLYNPHTMHVHTGQSGELYLNICGGEGEGQYAAWFSIVDGNIVYELEIVKK